MIWIIWFVACIGSFVYFEWKAVKKGTPTLSRSVWDLFRVFPLSGVALGMLFGGLLVHFFWHWCPPGSVSNG